MKAGRSIDAGADYRLARYRGHWQWCVWLWAFTSGNAALLPPSITPEGGLIHTPAPMVIANPNSNGEILYTLDGQDPRDPFGSVTLSAQCYLTPVSVNRSLLVRARVKSGTEWSPLVASALTGNQDFSNLLFTEVMYHPTDFLGLEEEEFVELKNVGDKPLDLSGLHLRDVGSEPPPFSFPPLFTFPTGAVILPGEFLVLAFDANVFREVYPGVPVFGEFSFRGSGLNERSARLVLLADNGAFATTMRYWTHDPWPVLPDNHGYFTNESPSVGFSLVRSTLNPEADPEDFRTWRASTDRFGSPGADDPERFVPAIYINELRSRSGGELQDTVELYNPNSTNVDLGGWWLSDARNVPYRYRIPAGMTIPPLGYLVLDESHFNVGEGAFSFSADGERCYLFSGNADGDLTGYSHGFLFHGSDRNAVFGRNRSSTGADYWLPEIIPTFGLTNVGPQIPLLMITEIMYHPESGEDQFIELKNTTASPLEVGNLLDPLGAWLVGFELPYGDLGDGERYFQFPPDVTIPGGGHVLLVSGEPESFRSAHGISNDVAILSLPEGFGLAAAGTLRVHRPTVPWDMRFVVIDEVEYRNLRPWDPGAAGGGQSLERINQTRYGSDPIHWRASPTGSSPGLDNSGNLAPLVWAGQDRVAFVGFATRLSGIVSDDRWPDTAVTSFWTQVSGPETVAFNSNTSTQTTVTMTQTGTYVLRLTAMDGFHTSTDDLVLDVIARPFDQWRGTNFNAAELADLAISGALGDPDLDGSNNVEEYFFGTLPKQTNSPRYRGRVENDQFDITWEQRLDCPDVVVEVERADTVDGPWFTGPGLFDHVETDEPSLGIKNVTFRSLLPTNVAKRQFIRLSVTLREE